MYRREKLEIFHCWMCRTVGLWVSIGCLGFANLVRAEPSNSTNTTAVQPGSPPAYVRRTSSPDGIGKWFMGREIAHFMSHHGAPWLEREEREAEENPSVLLSTLQLKPGQVVADVGAGSGYLTWRMALQVAPAGRVYANDIQPEMLAILRTNMAVHGITNVIPVLGSPEDPRLPHDQVDMAILVDVYHECEFPIEMVRGMVASLKVGGRLVLVEYRGEDDSVPIKPLHKMTTEQVRREMSVHPLEWVETIDILPRQHIIIFRKRSA